MSTKPTIVIHLCQLPADRSGRGSALPAHVRVAIHEPSGEDPHGGFGPIKNREGDFRWFLPAGMGMPQFFSENFKFEPQPKIAMQRLGVNAFTKPDEDVEQYVVNLNPISCKPHIDTFYLGEYEHNGVVHDVGAFCTHDLRTRIITPGRKGTVAYMLNTAQGYASEEFFDFLHLALTGHGFNTLYEKPSARAFKEVDWEQEPHDVKIVRYRCEATGQEMWARRFHNPEYKHPDFTVYKATKPEHLFVMDTPKKLRDALQHSLDWTGQFEVDEENFEWTS